MDNSSIQIFTDYVNQLVETGRYKDAKDAATEVLQSHAALEMAKQDLRDKLQASLQDGGAHTPADIDRHLLATYERLKQQRL